MSSDEVPPTDVPSPAVEGASRVDIKPLVKPAADPRGARLWRLPRLITSRTTDLLAIAIVLIASLTMGRQMLEWWQDEPPAVLDMGPLENLGAEWGGNSRPVTLEFGDSPLSMTRQVLSAGNIKAALDSVRQRCQTVLLESGPPAAEPDKGELEQLETLSKLTPELEQPGLWQVYTISGGLPLVIGVKTFTAKSGKTAAASPPDGRRVICWGLVFPGLSPGSWTTYTFTRRPADVGDSRDNLIRDFDLGRLTLPADCRRTVVMQEAGQSGLLGFQGAGRSDDWQRHFSGWLGEQGWSLPEGWQAVKGGWTGRFVRREPGRVDDSTLQIQCYQQPTGQGVGLIQLYPGRTPRPEPSPATSEGTP